MKKERERILKGEQRSLTILPINGQLTVPWVVLLCPPHACHLRKTHPSYEAEKRAWRNRCGSLCPFFLQICVWIPFFRQRSPCVMSMTVLMSSKGLHILSKRNKETAMFSSTENNVNILSLRHAKGLMSCGGGEMSGQSVAGRSWHPSHASTGAIIN